MPPARSYGAGSLWWATVELPELDRGGAPARSRAGADRRDRGRATRARPGLSSSWSERLAGARSRRRARRVADRDLHGDLRARPRSAAAASSTRSAPRPATDWICLISDDALLRRRRSRPWRAPSAATALRRLALAGAARLLRATSSAPCGWSPPGPSSSPSADQDDRWDPDKLEALVATLERDPAGRRSPTATCGSRRRTARSSPRRSGTCAATAATTSPR